MAVSIVRSSQLAAVGANAGAWTTDQGVSAPGMPTVLTTTPADPWVPAGAISDKGLSRAFNEKTQDVYALGQITPYLTLVSQSSATFTMEMYETYRDIVRSVMFRQPLSAVQADVTGKYTFEETGAGIIDRRSWLLAVFNGSAFEWLYLPSASVALDKDQTFVMDDVASVTFAVTPYPDDEGNTIYHVGQLPVGVYGA